MLTTPSHLLVLEASSNGFQKDLRHHIPGDWAEADQAEIIQILLLALLEDRSDVWYFSFLQNLPWSPHSFKDNEERPHRPHRPHDLSTHGWVPSGPMDLNSLFKCSLSWCFCSEVKSFLFQTFSRGLGLGLLKDNHMKTHMKKALTISVFSLSFVARSSAQLRHLPTDLEP